MAYTNHILYAKEEQARVKALITMYQDALDSEYTPATQIETLKKKLASARLELMELLETELPTPPSYDLDEDEDEFSLA